jgi:aminomethyltransferase
MSLNSETLLHTPLAGEHVKLGARMVPFAGWEMPVQYTGVIDEHNAVRQRAGMFDVSHMGRFEVHGPNAGRFLRYICTWDMTRLQPGEGHYAAACNGEGGILDDVYVFCLGSERWLIVVNASNAEKMRDWMTSHIAAFDAQLVDRHHSTAMIAVQGPEAIDRMGGDFVRSIKPRHCAETDWRGHRLFASRTGYTGEDGLEFVIDAVAAPDFWQELLESGVTPCGLGARDTLRLEAALLLYGNDIDEQTNPFESGLDWVVTLDDGADFVGRASLERIQRTALERKLVCLKALDRGVMRHGHAVLHNGDPVGAVTSGTFSPTLNVSIGMAYVPPTLADIGSRLEVDVRGRSLSVEVVPRPFYKRPKKA